MHCRLITGWFVSLRDHRIQGLLLPGTPIPDQSSQPPPQPLSLWSQAPGFGTRQTVTKPGLTHSVKKAFQGLFWFFSELSTYRFPESLPRRCSYHTTAPVSQQFSHGQGLRGSFPDASQTHARHPTESQGQSEPAG